MSSMIPRTLAACFTASLVLAAGTAAAQQNRFQVQSLTFYLWCQDTARLPLARCDQRLPDDVKRFEEYRTLIERYEIPYLQEREKQSQMNRTILNSDPVGDPLSKNPNAQSQRPTPTRTQNPP